MENNLLKEKLELNQNQALVYKALLQMGSGSIHEIASASRVKRTTAYSVLDNLMQRGLVNMVEKGAHREYFAENPKKIANLLEAEVAMLKEQQKSVLDILPELSSLYNANSTKPKIRTYEGMEGIKAVFYETLTLPRGSETLAFASYDSVHKYLWDWMPVYIKKRSEKGITQRLIAEDTPATREQLIPRDTQDIRETRLVPKDKFPFACDQLNIFGNRIFIASYKDLIAVVIESSAVATSMRSIFELAWLGAKQFGDSSN